MAKKRKLRSSEPEAAKAPEQPPPQQDPPPQLQPEELPVETLTQTIPIQSHDQQQTLDIAMETKDDEEENDDEEGGEEEDADLQDDGDDDDDDDDQTLAQNGGVSAGEANGGPVETDEDDEPVEKLLEPFSKEQLLSLVKQAVEKHPDFASNIRNLADADPAHRKIFVHGLGWDTTAETLTSEFGKFGEIEDCKAVTDRVSGKSKGYAFILFKRRSGARAALRQPQKKIGNRTTSSQLASAGPVPAPPPVGSSSSAVSAAASATAPSSEYTQRKIFVSNVSADVEPAKLLEYFRQFGEVEEGPLGLDRHTGKPKGFALFVYKTLESAKKALEEPHKTYEGLTLHCQKAIDGPKQSKPHHHNNNNQQNPHHHHHHHGQQNQHFHSRKDKNNKYPGPPGHLMAPSAPAPAPYPGGPQMNPALGQALTALLATQGAQLGIGNLLGGLGGAPVNQQGPPQAVYGNPAAGAYVTQPPMQGGYQNPQMGQGGVRPHHPGGPGAPYMGH